jgi:hypothetical protein
MKVTPEEMQILIDSLNYRKNYIQTDDPTLSPQDMVNCGWPERVKVIDTNQMRLVIQIEDLIEKLRK